MLSLLTTQEPSVQVPYDDLHRLRPQIEAALAYSGDTPTHTFMDIVQGIEEARFQGWYGKNSVLITEVKLYPQSRTVHIFLAGGDLEETIALQELVVEWGKMIGANQMSLCGRKGWKRALKKHGWGNELTVLRREI